MLVDESNRTYDCHTYMGGIQSFRQPRHLIWINIDNKTAEQFKEEQPSYKPYNRHRRNTTKERGDKMVRSRIAPPSYQSVPA
ncbi:MAG: hypothetical protein IIA05_10895 [Proteobacteria bacterium]|nr:hypothetical protein [Pseudomonadota bacterium]